MTYSEFIQQPSSEKVVLAWLEPRTKFVAWTDTGGSIFSKVINNYAVSVKESGTELTEVFSLGAIVSSGQWFFDDNNKTLYVRTLSDDDPTNIFLVVTLRLFFASRPTILPFDLESGREVEYEPYIENNPSLKNGLDHEDQSGIALEGSTTLRLVNADDRFKSLYDKLFWENARAAIFSYSPKFNVTKKFYDGFIERKSYSGDSITFPLKDFISRLRESIPLNLISASDGDVADSDIGKPKRRIYGRADGVKSLSVDKTLDGFATTGDVAGTAGSLTVTGTGTVFLTELSKDDQLKIDNIDYTIDSIASDTVLTLSDELQTSFASKAFTCLPIVDYRRKNRTLLIAGHALKEVSVLVTIPFQLNRIEVADASELNVGDLVTINLQNRFIKSISANLLVLTQTLSSLPLVGDPVVRNAVQQVFIKDKELVVDRDYTIDNFTAGASVVLDEDAEFNVTTVRTITGTVDFTNGSRLVGGTGTNYQTELKVRDFIKANGTDQWLEILSIEDDINLTVREAFTGSTSNFAVTIKKPEYVGDDTVVSVNTYGKTKDGIKTGVWIENASEVIKDLLDEADLTSQLSTVTFDNAELEAPFTISMALPLSPGSGAPILRDVVNLVNRSVFGSVSVNDDFQIEFNILSPKKPVSLPTLKDDDILTFKVLSNSRNISKKIETKFKHKDIDSITSESAFSVIEFNNKFAEFLSGSNRTLAFDAYLFDQSAANIMAQRKAFFTRMSQSQITITGKLNLSVFGINSIIKLDFDRMYERFGSDSSRDKIAIVSRITKTSDSIQLVLDDLGNMFNTTASVTNNTAPDFTSSEESDKIKSGYVTGSNGLINNIETTFNINLVG